MHVVLEFDIYGDEYLIKDEYKVGDIVYWVGPNVDERDRAYPDSEKSPLRIITLGQPGWSYDYAVQSTCGNIFYVKSHEIEN